VFKDLSSFSFKKNNEIMRVLVAISALLAAVCSQAPVFHQQFEARFTEVVETRIEGVWVTAVEVGTEWFDRPRNESRYEVVRYNTVNGREVPFPEQRIHQPTRSYTLRENPTSGMVDCTYGPSSALPDPATLTWKYNMTTFAVPPARYSQEAVWGARTVDVFESSFTDSNNQKVYVMLAEDVFTKETVNLAIEAPNFRSFRVYRDFFEMAPNSGVFVVPTYISCRQR
jgi:hypothetical protein